MNKSDYSLTVEVTRGEKVESQHEVVAVIMNGDKEILAKYGNIQEEIYPRSANKLLQALLLLESGAYSALNLDERHLALAASSHYADQIHTNLVHEWLNHLHLTEDNLRCGVQHPSRDSIRDDLIRKNKTPHRGHNNCSGKHSGLLTVCQHLGYEIKNYDLVTHPVQQDLIKTLSDVYEFDLKHSDVGIDGCGIPTLSVPLYNLNLGYINLKKRETGKKILDAIAMYPDLISGAATACTEITRTTKGRVFAKTGAEGVFCALSPVDDIFISIKVKDGSSRAAYFAIIFLLNKFGCFSADEANQLDKFLKPKIKNWEGLTVGEIRMQLPN